MDIDESKELPKRAARQIEDQHASTFLEYALKTVAVTGFCLVAIQTLLIVLTRIPRIDVHVVSIYCEYASMFIVMVSLLALLLFRKSPSIWQPSFFFLLWPPIYATYSLTRDFRVTSEGLFRMPSDMPPGLFFLMTTFGVIVSFGGRKATQSDLLMRARAIETGFRVFFVSNGIAFCAAFWDPANAAFFLATASVLSITISAYQLGYQVLAESVTSVTAKDT